MRSYFNFTQKIPKLPFSGYRRLSCSRPEKDTLAMWNPDSNQFTIDFASSSSPPITAYRSNPMSWPYFFPFFSCTLWVTGFACPESLMWLKSLVLEGKPAWQAAQLNCNNFSGELGLWDSLAYLLLALNCCYRRLQCRLLSSFLLGLSNLWSRACFVYIGYSSILRLLKHVIRSARLLRNL